MLKERARMLIGNQHSNRGPLGVWIFISMCKILRYNKSILPEISYCSMLIVSLLWVVLDILDIYYWVWLPKHHPVFGNSLILSLDRGVCWLPSFKIAENARF